MIRQTKGEAMKTIYFFDLTGLFAGSYELPEGDAFPLDATETAPPEVSEIHQARWNGADWTVENKRSPISY